MNRRSFLKTLGGLALLRILPSCGPAILDSCPMSLPLGKLSQNDRKVISKITKSKQDLEDLIEKYNYFHKVVYGKNLNISGSANLIPNNPDARAAYASWDGNIYIEEENIEPTESGYIYALEVIAHEIRHQIDRKEGKPSSDICATVAQNLFRYVILANIPINATTTKNDNYCIIEFNSHDPSSPKTEISRGIRYDKLKITKLIHQDEVYRKAMPYFIFGASEFGLSKDIIPWVQSIQEKKTYWNSRLIPNDNEVKKAVRKLYQHFESYANNTKNGMIQSKLEIFPNINLNIGQLMFKLYQDNLDSKDTFYEIAIKTDSNVNLPIEFLGRSYTTNELSDYINGSKSDLEKIGIKN